MTPENLVTLLKDPAVSEQVAQLLNAPAIKARLVDLSREPIVARRIVELLHDPAVTEAVAPLFQQALWWMAVPVVLSVLTLAAVIYNSAQLRKLQRRDRLRK